MIERVMSLPIFMFTRIALSSLIASIAGIMMISFLWMLWSFVDDVYNYLLFPEEAVVTEETSMVGEVVVSFTKYLSSLSPVTE